MELKKSHDLFSLSTGAVVTKRNLYDLVQYSKVEDSPHWSGEENVIGNTPQQGINWIGIPPGIQAVIIKTRPGSYADDGWADAGKQTYHYSFKARGGVISYAEKANAVLVNQPKILYPILLFTEHSEGWQFEGRFSVSEIDTKFVVLHRTEDFVAEPPAPQDEFQFQEGGKSYITHLMAERSSGVVAALKKVEEWVCDICNEDFAARYRVKYIEAHHKIPISTYSSSYIVNLEDFALLCPNCHKAVHIYMKLHGYGYTQIKNLLADKPDQ